MPSDENPLDEPVFTELGLRLTRWESGRAEFTLRIERRHLNLDARLHGGLVAMLLDVACGYAAMPEVGGRPGGGAVTVSLAVNYLAGATGGLVRARGWRTGGGRRIAFCSAELSAEDGTLVATAQGSMRLSARAGTS